MLFDAFAASFENADHVVVPEVYRSREPVDPGFSSQQVILAMRHPDAYYVSDWMDIPGFLQGRLKPDDVLLVLSAGDADQVSQQVYANLSRKLAHGGMMMSKTKRTYNAEFATSADLQLQQPVSKMESIPKKVG